MPLSAAARRRVLRSVSHAVLAGCALAAVPSAASASTGAWPSRPLRIVVPFPPGGSTDLLARRLAEGLAAPLGQPVIVENRPGAGGTVGADHVAKSPADGHTLLVGVTGPNAIAASLYASLPYDPARDFDPVTLLVSAPLVVVTGPRLPVATLADFVAHARAHPGMLTHGSPGNGTSMHLTGEMFALASGTTLNHVPYKGSAGPLNDLLGGQIDAMFGDVLVVLPHLKEGRLKALAVTSRQRHPMLPEVPTIAESGLAGFEALSWQGLFAPAGTPAPVLAKLNAEVVKILHRADMQAFFATRGFAVAGNTPAEARAFVAAEIAKWGRIVRAAGVRLD